jgi:hypothetical protein
MSRWALGIPSHFDESALPLSASTPQKGSLLWVDSPDPGNLNLRVWDGSGWKNIAFS